MSGLPCGSVVRPTKRYRLFEPGMAFYGIDARQTDALLQVIEDFRPEAVVNASWNRQATVGSEGSHSES